MTSMLNKGVVVLTVAGLAGYLMLEGLVPPNAVAQHRAGGLIKHLRPIESGPPNHDRDTSDSHGHIVRPAFDKVGNILVYQNKDEPLYRILPAPIGMVDMRYPYNDGTYIDIYQNKPEEPQKVLIPYPVWGPQYPYYEGVGGYGGRASGPEMGADLRTAITDRQGRNAPQRSEAKMRSQIPAKFTGRR